METQRLATLVLVLVTSVGAVSLKVHDDSCACLPWSDVYTKHGIRCGQGHEFGGVLGKYIEGVAQYNISDVTTIQTHQMGDDPGEFTSNLLRDTCTNFYEKLTTSSCMNKQHGYPNKQWCYVSRACKATNVELLKTRLTRSLSRPEDVALKTCDEKDELQSHKTPEELNRMAQELNLDTGMLGKLSYPAEHLTWSQVEKESETGESIAAHLMMISIHSPYKGARRVTKGAAERFAKVKDARVPTIFDDDNHFGGGTVVFGKAIYYYLPAEPLQGGVQQKYYYMCQNCGSDWQYLASN